MTLKADSCGSVRLLAARFLRWDMDDDRWVARSRCTVPAAHVEHFRFRLQRVIARRLKLDAWEMECQLLRDAQRGHGDLLAGDQYGVPLPAEAP